MPVVELNAFSTHMEVLQAQDSLKLSNIISVGTATMKRENREKLTREWGLVSGANAARRRTARRNAKAAGKNLPVVGLGSG